MSTANSFQEPTGIKFIFRTLKYRNYRLFFGGQGISLIGTWMQQTAMGWLVYRITGSAFLLGAVEFFSTIPVFFLTPFVGVLADRWNRHRMVIVIQSLAMLQAFILAFLTLWGTIEVWHIISMSLFLGFINSFDTPVRQSFVMDIIERREDIGNAIALNSSMFNLARLIGPSLAGLVIATTGEGVCFLLNGVSFIAVIIALFAMRLRPIPRENARTYMFQDIKEGFSYTFGFAPIRDILLLLCLVSMIGMPYAVLMPIFAKDIFHGGPHTLGFLMGGVGVGALSGAFFLASRKSVRGLERTIPIASAIFAFGLITFAFSRIFPLSLFLLTFCGFGLMVQMASSNTVLQSIADDDKRGRVMSYFTLAFRGTAPFGSLLAGTLASKMGAPWTLFIGGGCCLIGASLFMHKLPKLQRVIQPIYDKKLL